MSRWNSIPVRITVTLTCADCTGLLNTLIEAGVRIQDIVYYDDLRIRITVNQQDQVLILSAAEKFGAAVKIETGSGVLFTAHKLFKRPVLMVFLLFVLFLACFVPSRILFISVDGNAAVPEQYILEAANDCGIHFGASRRLVRSEIMKNKLLEKIPQLQWAGINTSGCTAVISVREKTTQEVQPESKDQVSSIVASRDGIIHSCTVLQGNPLCSVGQAVKAGQTLVSGYLNCGIVTKATQASAEIEAITFRELEVISPHPTETRGEKEEIITRYSLRIGKKRIKFYKDSGNLDTTCGKIYSEESVRLPGGFELPITIIKESVIHYSKGTEEPVEIETGEWLHNFAEAHLKENMISGQIISTEAKIMPADEANYLYGKYACIEMIGQMKYEQTVPKEDEP